MTATLSSEVNSNFGSTSATFLISGDDPGLWFAPSAALSSSVSIEMFAFGSGKEAQLGLYGADGVRGAPTARSAGEVLGVVGFGGFDGSGWGAANGGSTFTLAAFADENFSPTTKGSVLNFWGVPRGSNYRLTCGQWDGSGNVYIASPNSNIQSPAGSVSAGVLYAGPATAPTTVPSSYVALYASSVGNEIAISAQGATQLGVYSNNSGMAEIYAVGRGAPAAITAQRHNGTKASKTAVVAGDVLGTFGAKGWDGSQFTLGGYMQIVADGNWSPGSTPASINFPTIVISGVTISVMNGTVSGTKRLVVRASSSASWQTLMDNIA